MTWDCIFYTLTDLAYLKNLILCLKNLFSKVLVLSVGFMFEIKLTRILFNTLQIEEFVDIGIYLVLKLFKCRSA
jgi:hypothetical protein